MIYAEVIGFADTWFEESNVAEDIKGDIFDILNDVDLELDIKTPYQAEFLDMIKNN